MACILITGGTGLVGKALTAFLTGKGHEVIILTRDITGKTAGNGASFAKWDVKKQELDIAALQKADHIIHLAGAGVMEKKWTEAYKKEIVSSRADSARLLVNSLQQNSNKVRSVISASAIGWYQPTGTVHTEEEPADTSFLGETCRLWEESVEPVTALGKRLVKFRIGIVLSKHGGALKEFMTPLKLGVAAILGNGKQMISWIHITDLCRLFLFAIENEKTGGAYNAAAPAPVNNKTLTLTLAKKMKRFYIPVHVPSFILKIMLGGRSIEILKSTDASCKKIMDAGFAFEFNTIDAAVEDLVKRN
ncbi:TIGR01777 family oxidoreductase [Ferruginibacter sp.]